MMTHRDGLAGSRSGPRSGPHSGSRSGSRSALGGPHPPRRREILLRGRERYPRDPAQDPARDPAPRERDPPPQEGDLSPWERDHPLRENLRHRRSAVTRELLSLSAFEISSFRAFWLWRCQSFASLDLWSFRAPMMTHRDRPAGSRSGGPLGVLLGTPLKIPLGIPLWGPPLRGPPLGGPHPPRRREILLRGREILLCRKEIFLRKRDILRRGRSLATGGLLPPTSFRGQAHSSVQAFQFWRHSKLWGFRA